jgi:hypothetical protein
MFQTTNQHKHSSRDGDPAVSHPTWAESSQWAATDGHVLNMAHPAVKFRSDGNGSTVSPSLGRKQNKGSVLRNK